MSYTARRTHDSMLCGPVIDAVVLSDSSLHKPKIAVLLLVMLLQLGGLGQLFAIC